MKAPRSVMVDVAAVAERRLVLGRLGEDLGEQLEPVGGALERHLEPAGEGGQVGQVERIEVVQVEGLALAGGDLLGQRVERRQVREARGVRQVAVDRRRRGRGRLLGIAGRVAAAAAGPFGCQWPPPWRPRLRLLRFQELRSCHSRPPPPWPPWPPWRPSFWPPSPWRSYPPPCSAGPLASPPPTSRGPLLPGISAGAWGCGAGAGAGGASGSGLLSGTKISAFDSCFGSCLSAAGSAAAFFVRGLPRLTGLAAPSSGADVSSSVLGGRDIRVFFERGACLGLDQRIHDAVDLGLEESG